MMNANDICKRIRKDILDMTKATGPTGAHIGGAMSLVEILYCLYFECFDFKKDHIILSKGHGIMALYGIFNQLGLLKEGELLTFKKDETRLYAHPSLNSDLPIEFASGSLGQGLSLGVGEAIADKMNGLANKTIVVLGDGECDEGQIWEAAMSASHFSLDNLVAIVDCNQIQYDGSTSQIMNLEPLDKKWESFGWDVNVIDGHSIQEIVEALKKEANNKPLLILAKTIKGKGVSFMEGNPLWHNHTLNEEQYRSALEELSL